MLKLKLQHFWPPHVKSWLTGKDPDAGRDWGQEEKGTTEDDMASLTRWAWIWVNCGSWWWTRRPGVLRFTGSQRVGHDWVTELNWTHPNGSSISPFWDSSMLLYVPSVPFYCEAAPSECVCITYMYVLQIIYSLTDAHFLICVILWPCFHVATYEQNCWVTVKAHV